jgi:hypothetical protein
MQVQAFDRFGLVVIPGWSGHAVFVGASPVRYRAGPSLGGAGRVSGKRAGATHGEAEEAPDLAGGVGWGRQTGSLDSCPSKEQLQL